ncbi:MAG: hypothetical protein HeimC2_03560 [Candidatus Heimdallarchaeota archaeon LC_2]|nr:MAG: hypothetical protein HeimC2_03560 [Candidatus Heimdallarchaeota archaeon LC_2]
MIKNKIFSFSLLAVILVLGSGFLVIGSSNGSNDYELSSIGESTSYNTNALTEILVVHADSVTSLDFAFAGLVDYSAVYLDAQSATPALTDLSSYPLVILMNNWNYYNSTAMGNVVADYIDQGGKVLLLAHSFSSGYSILGRFNSSGYSPVWGSVSNINRTYDGLSNHAIMNGINSFNPGYAQTVSLTSGAKLVASYTDGQPMVAEKGSVVALNAYVGLNVVGDLGEIITNAVDYLLYTNIPVIDNLITFDEVPNFTNLTNAYSGVTFSWDWESWVTSGPFIASSAPSVAYSYDFNNFVQFDQAAKFVSVYVTNVFSLPIFLEGYDSLGKLVSNATIPGNVEAFYVSVASDVPNIDNIHFNYAPSTNGQWVIDDLHWSTNPIPTAYSEWITFDTLPGSTILETAYSGVTFSFDWLTWNSTSTSFTASSPHFVAYSYDFKNFIQFDQPARYVSVYVTNVGSEPFPVEALNSTGGIVAIVNIPANTETYFVSLSSSTDDISSIHFDYPIADDGQWIIDNLSWGGNQLIGDNTAPIITGPVELLVELGDPSAQVQWLITDDSDGSFNIYLNGTSLSSGSWTDGLFQPGVDLTPFTPGTYEFQLNTTDIYGNEASFTTIVFVRDTVAPVIGSALDRYSYVVGSTLNVLFWQPSDVDPDTYVIYRTDVSGVVTMLDNGFWSDFVQIGLDIDGLEVGEYVYRAEFSDGSGNVGVAETIVTVEPEVVSSEPTGNTSDDPTTSVLPTSTSEPRTTTSDPNISEEETTAELPLPFSNIYLIIFSILGLTIISRKKKNFS